MLRCENALGLHRPSINSPVTSSRTISKRNAPRLAQHHCQLPQVHCVSPPALQTSSSRTTRSQHRPSPTAVGYRHGSQSERQAADTAAVESMESLRPVSKEDHWSTLLTTMPNLSSRSWSGRVGEFITHSGSTTNPDNVSVTGSILHMWKANVAESQTTGGEADKIELPESVAINYYTADGLAVTQEATPSDADSGAVYVWDQQQLAAKPTKFVFSPDAPQLSLTLSGWQQQAPVMYRVLRLLPLSSSGVAIVNVALPDSFGPDVAAAQPPGTYWFFEVLLTHPDASGEWQASTLGVAYDWSSGELSSHRYSWQKVTQPVEEPHEDISRVTIKAVQQPNRDSTSDLSSLMSKLSDQSQLQHTQTSYCYSQDDQQQLMRSQITSTAGGDCLETADGEQSGLVTLWFPHGGMYAKVPAQIAAVGGDGGQVTFEVGAVHGDGVGLSTCLLMYETTGASDSSRRLKKVVNDEWVAQLEL